MESQSKNEANTKVNVNVLLNHLGDRIAENVKDLGIERNDIIIKDDGSILTVSIKLWRIKLWVDFSVDTNPIFLKWTPFSIRVSGKTLTVSTMVNFDKKYKKHGLMKLLFAYLILRYDVENIALKLALSDGKHFFNKLLSLGLIDDLHNHFFKEVLYGKVNQENALKFLGVDQSLASGRGVEGSKKAEDEEGSETKVIIEEMPVTDKFALTITPGTYFTPVRKSWLPYIHSKEEKTNLFYKVIEKGGDKIAHLFYKEYSGNKVELQSFILHGKTWKILKRFSRRGIKRGIKPVISSRFVKLEKNTKYIDLFLLCKRWADSDINETRLFTRIVEPKRASKIAEIFCLVGDMGIILEKYKKKKDIWIPLESLGNVESRKIPLEVLSEIPMVHKTQEFTRADYILDIIIDMIDYSDAMLMPLFKAKRDKIDYDSYGWFKQKGNLKRARFVVENLLEESSYDHLMKSVSIAKRFVDEFMDTLQLRKDKKEDLGNDESLIEAVQDYYEFARTKHEELRKILTDLENIKRHSLTHLKKILQSIIVTRKEI